MDRMLMLPQQTVKSPLEATSTTGTLEKRHVENIMEPQLKIK